MKNVLIAEDESSIRDFVVINLRRNGYEVIEATNGDEAIKKFDENSDKIDIVILDIMMPYVDGLEVCKYIREKSKRIGIIMLTARTQEMDKVTGLMVGADDYVTKPFSPKILVAKIKALLKRSYSKEDNFSNCQNYNGLIINKLAHEVKINNEVITLSPKEFELLIYLSDNMGISLTRDTILDNVWGIDYYGDLRTVDTNIKRLREKLGQKSNYIVTVRGSGYKFEVKDEK